MLSTSRISYSNTTTNYICRPAAAAAVGLFVGVAASADTLAIELSTAFGAAAACVSVYRKTGIRPNAPKLLTKDATDYMNRQIIKGIGTGYVIGTIAYFWAPTITNWAQKLTP